MEKMRAKLSGMKLLYLLVVGSLLAQPVFPHNRDKGTAIWIDFDGTIATNEAFETLALAAYNSMTKEKAVKYPPWRRVIYLDWDKEERKGVGSDN